MGLDISFLKAKKGEANNMKEVAYFRKVNFLVKYFQYEENCSLKKLFIPKVQLLLDYCVKVLGDRSEETSKKLLPTQGGFFFGSTEYDQWYYEDVERVYEIFKEILDDLSDDEDLFMYCWW